uniref:Uncharacterized protein n=1 Tax=Anguilla anguilla TaxID=7936 RepID=A0A0E9R533_ANGAN
MKKNSLYVQAKIFVKFIFYYFACLFLSVVASYIHFCCYLNINMCLDI